MDKKEKSEKVRQAYEEVRTELGAETFKMLSMRQRLQLTQAKLPTKPLYSTAVIKQIIFDHGSKQK